MSKHMPTRGDVMGGHYDTHSQVWPTTEAVEEVPDRRRFSDGGRATIPAVAPASSTTPHRCDDPSFPTRDRSSDTVQHSPTAPTA